jgi:primosomal protein N' (replication factor Y)
MATFAEVILPLPLRGTFTYEVPEEMIPSIEHGARVYVQFGRKKHYTGIVTSMHTTPPQGYSVKPILMVLDANPIIRYPQFKLWQWISDYYLCTVGETYKAAIPSGLKIESESYISLNKEYDLTSEEFSENETLLMMQLEHQKRVRLSEIENADHTSKRFISTLNNLIEKGVVITDEAITDRYRPKKVSFVRLKCGIKDDEALHAMFDKVHRSLRQERMLITILEQVGKSHDGYVEKAELLKNGEFSPAILKGLVDKDIVEVVQRRVNRFNYDNVAADIHCNPLTQLQEQTYDRIKELWKERDVVLLRGVTGSGKTEIYCRAIAAALAKGDQALYLVPEISLTTQLTNRLRTIFGNRLVVYHSKFSDNERVDIWNKILETHAPMVILGARSSVFLPFAHLGVVIVDEEHEASYKQYDPAPRYNARDTAIVLATMHKAKVLLGSATPSIETYYKATTGKYGLVELTQRYQGAMLPKVDVVDMRNEHKKRLSHGIISSVLSYSTTKALRDGWQAIMFQNRRGFAPMVVCKECGWQPKCQNCDVSMVYHKGINQLTCHYCGYTISLPTLCPACGQNSIETYGFGTERIAEDVQTHFPDAKVARMDLDTTRNKDSYQQLIEEFASHKTDILIGTQMVSKGLDFEKVKIVGVMNADTMLHYPDFRAHERAFNMMVQVAGRAGRRDEKGEVIIQTTDPENPLFNYITTHDYMGYYNHEINERATYHYPPFTKIIVMYLKNKDEHIVRQVAAEYATRLRQIFGERVMGPCKPSVGRIATYFLQTVMLKVEANASMVKVKVLLAQVFEQMAHDPRMKSTQLYYDVDPV